MGRAPDPSRLGKGGAAQATAAAPGSLQPPAPAEAVSALHPPEQPLLLPLGGCGCLLKGLFTEQNLHLLQEFSLKQQFGTFLVLE